MDIIHYTCDICNKLYSSHTSLATHKRNYHPAKPLIYKCSYCNIKEYTVYTCFKRHEKMCKEKNKKEQEIEIEKNKIKYELEILKLMKESLEIKNKKSRETTSKNYVKPLTLINNIYSNTTNITTNNINYICNFVTREDINSPNHIKNLLSRKEQIEFAKETHPANFITSIVQKTYCEYFKNVYLTNLNGKYIYVYKDNKFIVANCNETIDNMIKGKLCEFNEMMECLLDENKNKLPRIQDVIMKKLHIKKNDFFEERKNENFTKKNKEKIIIMLYNNQENIKEVYTLIANEELDEEQLKQIALENVEYTNSSIK